MRLGAASGWYEYIAGRKKGGALKYETHTRQYLGTRVPGTGHIGRSFGELGLGEESVGGPDRFLPSAIVLDPACQRLQPRDGPSVQLRRASEHCLGNREVLEVMSKIVNANASRFSGVVKFRKFDRTPPPHFEIISHI